MSAVDFAPWVTFVLTSGKEAAMPGETGRPLPPRRESCMSSRTYGAMNCISSIADGPSDILRGGNSGPVPEFMDDVVSFGPTKLRL